MRRAGGRKLALVLSLLSAALLGPLSASPGGSVELEGLAPSPFLWTNPTYQSPEVVRSASLDDPYALPFGATLEVKNPHPHMTFVPDGLTLLDGTEPLLRTCPGEDPRYAGKPIEPIALPHPQTRFDPHKKTVIFVVGYDRSGRAYNFFDTPDRAWGREYNTFVYRWGSRAFVPPGVSAGFQADHYFRATEEATADLEASLLRLKNQMGVAYDGEIRFVSISTGGELVLRALYDLNQNPETTFSSQLRSASAGRGKYLRRADFLDPAFLLMDVESAAEVTTAYGQPVDREKYDDFARQFADLESSGFVTTAYAASYGNLITTNLYRYVRTQRMDEDWLEKDYTQGAIPGLSDFYAIQGKSLFDVQHVATVSAYFLSLGLPGVSSQPELSAGFSAATDTAWLKGQTQRLLLEQVAGADTLDVRDDRFEPVDVFEQGAWGLVMSQAPLDPSPSARFYYYRVPLFGF